MLVKVTFKLGIQFVMLFILHLHPSLPTFPSVQLPLHFLRSPSPWEIPPLLFFSVFFLQGLFNSSSSIPFPPNETLYISLHTIPYKHGCFVCMHYRFKMPAFFCWLRTPLSAVILSNQTMPLVIIAHWMWFPVTHHGLLVCVCVYQIMWRPCTSSAPPPPPPPHYSKPSSQDG